MGLFWLLADTSKSAPAWVFLKYFLGFPFRDDMLSVVEVHVIMSNQNMHALNFL